MEHIVHTNISQRFQDLKAGNSSCKEFFKRLPDGGISIPAGEMTEISVGSTRNVNSSKVPQVNFPGKCGQAP